MCVIIAAPEPFRIEPMSPEKLGGSTSHTRVFFHELIMDDEVSLCLCVSDGPKTPQDGPKTAQEGPKKAPRRPKTAQDEPKTAQD